jgi:hypothetical protein
MALSVTGQTLQERAPVTEVRAFQMRTDTLGLDECKSSRLDLTLRSEARSTGSVVQVSI